MPLSRLTRLLQLQDSLQVLCQPFVVAYVSFPVRMRESNCRLRKLTTQIVCYGVGIVSASLDIVNIVRGWRAEGTSLEDPSQKTG